MSRARLIRLSLLPGMLALTPLMAYATDVITGELLDARGMALALTLAAVAAISMAGSVLVAAQMGTE